MNIELLVISIFHIVSAAVILSFGFFVLLKKITEIRNVIFFLLCLSAASFNVIFLVGSNIVDPILSWKVWVFNSTVVFIAIFYAHFYLYYVTKEKEKYKLPIKIIYSVGFFILAIIAIFPRAFLPYVEPRMYFDNYLVAGPIYWLVPTFFVGVGIYTLLVIIKKYRLTKDDMERRRFEYFIFAAIYGYVTGSTAFFLVYNIPIDPILSPLNGTFIIPIAYGVIKQQVLDIRVVIKRTFIYSILIALSSLFLISITFLNQWFVSVIPGLPFWIVPILAGSGSVLIGRLFWNKSQESDLLKYEFITIAAHKLRTPLTEMKWEIENILLQDPNTEIISAANRLRNTNEQLIMLSDALVESSDAEKGDYSYNLSPTQLNVLTDEVIEQFEDIISEKDISLTFELDKDIPTVKVDADRIKSVIRVFIENAIVYSPIRGQILIQIEHKDEKVTFSIADNGIGITKDEKSYIFTKFYRARAAKIADTEGIGIGLYISKSIIERHGGYIGFSSDGANMGSRFWFSLNT